MDSNHTSMNLPCRRIKRTSISRKTIFYLDWLYHNCNILGIANTSNHQLVEKQLTADDIRSLTDLFALNEKEIANILQLF